MGKCTTAPPIITMQPANQTQTAGNNASFGILVTGSPLLGYQWQLNSNHIPGATNATLTLANVQAANAGSYSVIVSNAFGTATSSNASLAVNPANCTPPPPGLVSWWPGESNATDIVSGNNGTLKGNATFGAGKVNQAFVFDGNGDGVVVGNPTNLQLQNFTIEAWVKRNNTTQASINAGGGVVFGYGHGGYALIMADNGLVFLGSPDISFVQGVQAVSGLVFHHVAVTKNGSNVVFYVDGVADPAVIYNAVFQATTPAAIGARGDNLANSFLGEIDEVSVYNRALTASEIQSIYNAGSDGKCVGAPPVIGGQPASQTVPAGTNVTFSVSAAGSAPLGYQWQLNSNNLAGATNATLTLTNVQAVNAGNYLVIVSNPGGSITSSNALLTVTPISNCTPPPSGLVSWWPGEGNGNDIAGGNNGTLKGNATFGAGKVNEAFVFDGNGDGVVVGNPTNLRLQNFTVEAWVKRGSTNQASLNVGGGVVFGYGHAGYSLFIGDNGTIFLGSIEVSFVQSVQKVTDTAFHHVAVTKNGSGVVFYVDGVADPAVDVQRGVSGDDTGGGWSARGQSGEQFSGGH